MSDGVGGRPAVSFIYHERPRQGPSKSQCVPSAGDRLGEADVQLSLGEIHQTLRDHEESLRHYELALDAYRELGDQRGRALTLWRSGGLLIATARTSDGATRLREALAPFETLGAAEADEVRAEIERIDGDEQGPTTSARRP